MRRMCGTGRVDNKRQDRCVDESGVGVCFFFFITWQGVQAVLRGLDEMIGMYHRQEPVSC